MFFCWVENVYFRFYTSGKKDRKKRTLVLKVVSFLVIEIFFFISPTYQSAFWPKSAREKESSKKKFNN